MRLNTPRLTLRTWRDDDLDALAGLCADAGVMRHFPAPLDRAGSAALLARLRQHAERHGITFWRVERRDDGAFLGMTGLARVDDSMPCAPAVEIGWRLARAFWGQGYALEAARCAVDFAFGELGLERLVAFTVPANRHSWGLMERLGMRRDAQADFDHPQLPEGHPLRRHLLYRLRRADWPRR